MNQKGNSMAPPPKDAMAGLAQCPQISISCAGTLSKDSWRAGSTPTVQGTTRVYKKFKPLKAILSEWVGATYNNSLGPERVVVVVPDADDLRLISAAFAGRKDCFPPTPGRSPWSGDMGGGITWPTINGDLTVTFAVSRTALRRAAPPLGYVASDLTAIEIVATLHLFGEIPPAPDTLFERVRLFLASAEYLPLADERRACELRHALRKKDERALREAAALIAGIHPARTGQAELLGDLHAAAEGV